MSCFILTTEGEAYDIPIENFPSKYEMADVISILLHEDILKEMVKRNEQLGITDTYFDIKLFVTSYKDRFPVIINRKTIKACHNLAKKKTSSELNFIELFMNNKICNILTISKELLENMKNYLASMEEEYMNFVTV